ncbi:HpcH/HpaI aldolase/citrate lyase family protein [Halomonas sp. THAF12]|uniref:2-dehydro-3-deoxyglucarate aldolase/4-hydroxy-2-oxoheptanedioate aldolase n=1 Tax=Halomonas organivorans TaxID=257772 RepID=A0A7W5BYN7_9GAMM|nr:HpcH/HpaI aldolase/citrate lyase family protein [Halomonas organivorans]MBB3140623.1 2-dehydro-3-deoxyglucarate aldolase/4-hydroxy-2-oxoheptanedioate aldolase [Halomonas organivorans]
MTLPVNRFKQWLGESRVPVGTWLMTASPNVAEAIGFAGFDYVVLDMEHVPVDVPQAMAIMQAVAGTPAELVVRLPWNDPVMVKRMLDSGAQTLMFPYIQNAEEARQAVASTRYPGRGFRGVAAVHRASRYGTVKRYLQEADREIGVILQLETPEALAVLPEIAEVDDVDAVFVGPGDLSAAMDHIGDIRHPEVQEAIAGAVAACRARDLPCGIVGADPALVGEYIAKGFAFVAIGSDMSLMMSRAQEYLAAVRGESAATENSGVY